MLLKKTMDYLTIKYQKFFEFFLRARDNTYYIFMFHDVVKDTSDMYDPEFCITMDSFTLFCDKLKKNLNQSAWIPVITFDDGFQGVFENAYPILKSMSLNFTIFVTCDFLDQERYLSSDQLKELSQNSLCTIGSHTKSHSCLSKLSKEKLWEEIHQSKAFLQNLIRNPVECFAYPYGDIFSVKKREKKCVRDAGYKYAFGTLCAGFDKNFQGNYYIPRINVNEANWQKVVQDSLEGKM